MLKYGSETSVSNNWRPRHAFWTRKEAIVKQRGGSARKSSAWTARCPSALSVSQCQLDTLSQRPGSLYQYRLRRQTPHDNESVMTHYFSLWRRTCVTKMRSLYAPTRHTKRRQDARVTITPADDDLPGNAGSRLSQRRGYNTAPKRPVIFLRGAWAQEATPRNTAIQVSRYFHMFMNMRKRDLASAAHRLHLYIIIMIYPSPRCTSNIVNHDDRLDRRSKGDMGDVQHLPMMCYRPARCAPRPR